MTALVKCSVARGVRAPPPKIHVIKYARAVPYTLTLIRFYLIGYCFICVKAIQMGKSSRSDLPRVNLAKALL